MPVLTACGPSTRELQRRVVALHPQQHVEDLLLLVVAALKKPRLN
jgi:hypothetical protein